MSKKIILSENHKEEILAFAKNTYQCTIRDICDKFNISRNTLLNNISKDMLDTLIYHGCKDVTKLKLRITNLGKKDSQETRDKKSQSSKRAMSKRTAEEKKAAVDKAKATKIKNFGSWQSYCQYQVEQTKKTKLERYNSENYQNIEKCKKTKLERYGDENYNNKDKIAKTQFEKYGGYAFNDWDKVHKTNLERYGVEHNWSSPEHDGHEKRYAEFDGKENYYKHIQEKSKQTKLFLYGDEFYSNSAQAQQTMLAKYGYTSYMCTDEFRQKTVSRVTRDKALQTKRENHTFNVSQPEIEITNILIDTFGSDNIITHYRDQRYSRRSDGYMFECDFYIKSLDLFIELNLHPSHGIKPFMNDAYDIDKLSILKSNLTPWNKVCIEVWTLRDPEKRQIAEENNLNYITIYPSDDYHNILKIIEERGF